MLVHVVSVRLTSHEGEHVGFVRYVWSWQEEILKNAMDIEIHST